MCHVALTMRRAALLGSTLPLLFLLACSKTSTPPARTARAVEVAQQVEVTESCATAQQIQRTLSARNMAFQDCYAEGLARDPMLQGTVTLSLVIPPSGEVDEVRVSSSDLKSDSVSRCIAEVATGIIFPQESCSLAQTVEYPVRLARGSSEFAAIH